MMAMSGCDPAVLESSCRQDFHQFRGRNYLGQPNVSAAAQAAKESGKKPAFSPLAPAGPAERRVEMPLPNGTYAPDGPWQAWKESFPNIPPTAPFVLNLAVIDESRDRAEEMARKYSERNFHWIAKNYSTTESFEGLKG
jgi:hypothetical protein